MPQLPRLNAQSRNFLMTVSLVLGTMAVACRGEDHVHGTNTGGSTASTGGSGGSSTGGQSGTGGTGTGGTATGGAATGGAATGGAATGGAATGGAATGGAASGGSSASGGSGGATTTATGGTTGGSGGAGGREAPERLDHCVYGYQAQPTDDDMKDGPAEYYAAGKTAANTVDLIVQPAVLSWMQSHYWEAAHVEWHAIRTCNLPSGPRGSKVDICRFVDMIPKNQTCATTGDGYEFMLFHRHMIESLKQLWPKHTEQFTGFPKFPQAAADVPPQWQSAWTKFNATALANAKIADEIDKPENLKMFPDEGAFGFWLQCQLGTMIAGFNVKASGLHGDLHGHWVRQGNTDHGIGNTQSNIDNYMFWKLHGWMDNVWEKYRVAKGLKRTDPKYVADLQAQCHEMDAEAEIVRTMAKPGQMPGPLPVESGFFHEKVRPIFESVANKCSGCHAEAGPEAGMSLGGNISSKDIVAGLVNQPAIGGGQYKRIAPGKPDESWLYRKLTAMTATCAATSTSQCFTGPMPPSSDGKTTVSAADAAIVRQWIMDGAPGPS